MMVAILIWVLYALFFGISALIIVYLIYKRIKNRGKENFEQRDN